MLFTNTFKDKLQEARHTYDPAKIEHEILEFWKKNGVFEKLAERNRGGKIFSFLDGPITANNPMGVHHAWGRTLKDVFQRFKAMQGYDQRFQNGFDCQGLWVEVEVEKDLGFDSKKDIERFGLENFSRACRERVDRFAKKISEQSARLGQWMDWENSYYTMDDRNIEAIWHFLKRCFENGWLYKGTRVLPWCIRCGTSSSKHEMSDQGYADIVHPGLFVKFRLKGKGKEYLLVWTTTAWTLTSNVAAAVNPGFTYAKVEIDGKVFYLSEKRMDALGKSYKKLGSLKGSELAGLEYESPYGNLEAQKGVRHRVVEWDMVSEEEGTGIVHIAPGCGEEDNELGKKLGLEEISPLDEAGNFIEGFGQFTGRNVKNIAKEIISDLESRNILFKVEDCKHRYPVCWRCKEELVFRLGSEWFIRSDDIRLLMKKAAEKVKWVPDYAGKRMQDWLDNMGDWNISRKRFWGLPLMFFECRKCGNLEVIGSRRELKEKAVNRGDVDRLPELHRPWIDDIKIKCECGETVERVKEVGDCWLDAGIVPFSTMGYFKDRSYWEKWFPADLVLEAIPQVKLWFYATLFMSVTLQGVAPYKNVVATDVVVDEGGEEMHKTKGNAIWFDDAVEKMGADVMRWIYVKQNNRYPLKFGYTAGREAYKALNIIYNTAKYVQTYCEANGYIPGKGAHSPDVASRWLLSRLETVKADVTRHLEGFEYYRAAAEIENFIVDDFSRWYIHLVRPKLKPGEGADKSLLHVIYRTMLDSLRMLAPFIPFLAEKLYRDFAKSEGAESIHLHGWPEAEGGLIDKKLEGKMSVAKAVFEACSFARQKAGLKLRWPIREVVIMSGDENVKDAAKDLGEILSDMCNSKSVRVTGEKVVGDYSEVGFYHGAVLVPNKMDEKLVDEAMIRETIRHVQELRKKSGLAVGDKISLFIDSDAATKNTIEMSKEMLKKEVGAKDVVIGKISGKSTGELKFGDKSIRVGFDMA